MSRLKLLLSLIAILGLGLSAMPVAAQDEGTPSALDDPSQLEGIERAVSRDWSVDFAAMAESPEAMEGGLFLVSAQAMQFETDDNASAAYALYLDEGVASITSDPSLLEEAEVTHEEIDLGDEAYQINVIDTSEDQEGAYRVVFARDGNFIYLVLGVASTVDSADLTNDILDYMINEGEPGDGEGTFDEEGGSEGGLWDIFPPADHPALANVVANGDTIEYPAP